MSKFENIENNAKFTVEQVSNAIKEGISNSPVSEITGEGHDDTTPLTAEANREVLVYCGPNINNGEIKQYSTFQYPFPKFVEKHMENAAVKNLFVNPSELAKVRKNIDTPGTLEHQLYINALEYVQGGKQ